MSSCLRTCLRQAMGCREPECRCDLQSASKPRGTEAQGVENEYETFQICPNWQEHAATTELVLAMREFRDMVKELQQDAELR